MNELQFTGQVTGIGSLPHLEAEVAVEFVAQFSPTIPFWSQLPQRSPSEKMIAQMLAPLLELVDERGVAHLEVKPGKSDYFRWGLREAIAALDENSAAGFFAFERACQVNRFPKAVAIKGQVSGPVTLGWCLFQKGRPYSAQPEIFPDLVDYVCRLAAWQVARLNQFGKPVILFIDEPMLAFDVQPEYLSDGMRKLIATIHAAGAMAGIHCCATPAPVSICSLRPDIISFDANQGLEAFLLQPETRTFIKNKGCLAFGLVPTSDKLGQFQPAETFVRWASVANECCEVQKLARQSLVTATCGLGLLSVEAARVSFQKAAELSHLIKKVADYGAA